MKYSSKNKNFGRKMSLQDGEVSYESIWNLLQEIIFTNHMSHQSSRLEREALVSITQKWKRSEIFLKNCDFSETQNLPKGAPEIQNSRFRKDASHHCATIVYGSALKQRKHQNLLIHNFDMCLPIQHWDCISHPHCVEEVWFSMSTTLWCIVSIHHSHSLRWSDNIIFF